MRFGFHVSIAGGVFNAPGNAAAVGCEVFQMFTRSPRGGKAPELTSAVVKQFAAETKKHRQAAWYVHTPYYVNFASENNRIRYGTIAVVREELERASQLKVSALMTHLGSAKDTSEKAARQMVVEGLAKMLDGYTGSTRFLIELAAGAGAILGDTFEEIADYIQQVEKQLPKLRGKIGVCLDTCHAFTAGYDLRTAETVDATLKKFDETIGLERLALIHANDSKADFGIHIDRHEHLGAGKIGKAGFAALVKHPKLQNIDFILETPKDGKEVEDLKLLKSLRDEQ
ncbi:MAG: deoxyribonuclease IV [Patescibacteria group bacterium]|nr:deoxyribonuclease IV [Patescibacteria group bacterium]